MKILFGLLLGLSATICVAQGVGEKHEPRCGEPCEHCAGGIKQCRNTLDKLTDRGSKTLADAKTQKAKKKQATKQ